MRSILSLALLAATLTGCAALDDDDSGDQLEIAASFYPLAFVAEEVSGGPVDLLTTPGAEPHDFELTIKETSQISDADLVLFEHGFQPAVDDAVAQTAEGEVLDAAEVVDLNGDDPHFWLDPLLMADLADAVAGTLAGIEPDRAQEFEQNADRLRGELEELDREYTTGLTDCTRDTVVVSHDAFGYLERYGVHLEPIAGLSPDAEPTPAHLAALQELVRAEGITTVFAETLGSHKMADTLSGDLGVATEILDPIEGIAADSTEDYLTIMRTNLDRLEEANGC